MKIRKRTLVPLFIALGFKKADDWVTAKFQRKLDCLLDIIELPDTPKVTDPHLAKLLKSLCTFLEKGEEIKVVKKTNGELKVTEEDEEAEPESEEETKTKGKKVKKEKKKAKKTSSKKVAGKKKKVTKKKETSDVDKFECRCGTQSAAINSFTTEEPKTAEAIAKGCRLPLPRVRSHLGTMIKRGWVTKTKDGKFKAKK